MPENIIKTIMRFRFSKLSDMKYISHLDLINLLVRALRRAKIPMFYSKGYHPKPKLSTGYALKVGWESVGEYADIILSKMLSPKAFVKRINGQLPQGLRILKAKLVESSQSLSSQINCMRYQLIFSYSPELVKRQESDLLLKMFNENMIGFNNQLSKNVKYFKEKLLNFKIRSLTDNIIMDFLIVIGSPDDLKINDLIKFLNSLQYNRKIFLKRIIRINMFRKEGDLLLSPFTLLR